MHVTFKYSEREFISAMKQIHNSKRIVFDFVLAIALFSYGVYSLMSDSNDILDTILVVISLIFLFISVAKLFIVPRMAFRREPKFKEEYHLLFNDDGILFKAGGINSNITWDYYNGIKETKDFIYLYYGKRGYSIIPKRAFENNEEVNKFLTMLRSKITT
ncbi:YcxB family protein [Paenibacillus sp. SN-8-1]|uniref:YcxB family protein n=1 Tax=Paenibacillus sp. SN-8-1 TaxID=3435409 RepID=UPI003D9A2DB4